MVVLDLLFAPVVVDYLFGGISAVNPTIDDVPDKELQRKIKKVLFLFIGLFLNVLILCYAAF